MLRLHCQACGRSVDARADEAELVACVRVQVIGDEATAWRDHDEYRPVEADLCRGCIQALRGRYFGVDPAGERLNRDQLVLAGPPAMPTYLEVPE